MQEKWKIEKPRSELDNQLLPTTRSLANNGGCYQLEMSSLMWERNFQGNLFTPTYRLKVIPFNPKRDLFDLTLWLDIQIGCVDVGFGWA